MNRAEQIVDALLSGSPYAAPAPTAPPKPTTTPTRPQTPSKPRPGTRPWSPGPRPGVNPRPKARYRRYGVGHDQISFAEAEGQVSVPPAGHDQEVPQAQPEPAPLSSLCDHIRPGDRVTIITPHNQNVTGRAVMRNRAQGCWVLNAGGPHGRPVIASEENIVSIRRGGKVIYGK